ncbi:MAG TPA: glycosyltransferase [Microvirga sp.]|nr:glycosyltransferase [Microvirga sp.]
MTGAIPVAFYAPLKSPNHPSPSGDRTMARLLLEALTAAGFAPALASEIRTLDTAGHGEVQAEIRARSEAEAARLVETYRALPPAQRPRLWFTYHVYYKAPDWIGPVVADALGIPYAVAEGSRAAKRASGPWALGHRGAEAALDRADALFVMTAKDRVALKRDRRPGQILVDLPPFLDEEGWISSLPAMGRCPEGAGGVEARAVQEAHFPPPACGGEGSAVGGAGAALGFSEPASRQPFLQHTGSGTAPHPLSLPAASGGREKRSTQQQRASIPPDLADAGPPSLGRESGEPRLLTVAMMRRGDKLASYRILAEALGLLRDRPWTLTVAGDGEARAEVEALFVSFENRVTFLGQVDDRARLAALYREADLLLWPAVNEAYGMVLLEAQAMGCPVVAGDFGGVASVVEHGRTGHLALPGDAAAFAAAIRGLLDDPARIASLSEAAFRFVREERSLGAAALRLGAGLAPLLAGGRG